MAEDNKDLAAFEYASCTKLSDIAVPAISDSSHLIQRDVWEHLRTTDFQIII